MESKKKKRSMNKSKRITDLYLHKMEKEILLKKKNKKQNQLTRIQNQKTNTFQKNKDELISHFQIRKSLLDQMEKPKNEKEWNFANSLSECYANQILLHVTYSESVEKHIQQILLSKNK